MTDYFMSVLNGCINTGSVKIPCGGEKRPY